MRQRLLGLLRVDVERLAAPKHLVAADARDAELLGARFRDALLDLLRYWPAFVPPFGERVLAAAPAGHLLIKRLALEPSVPTRYGIIDRTGARVGVLSTPCRVRLAGTGQRALYVVRTADDGIEYIVRCAWRRR